MKQRPSARSTYFQSKSTARCGRVGFVVKFCSALLCATLVLGCGPNEQLDPPTGDTRAGAALSSADELDQSKRRAEVDRHLAAHYFTKIRPVVTKIGPSGETVDWIDPRDLDPSFDARVPPPEKLPPPTDRSLSPANRIAAPDGADIAALWRDPRYAGPAGTAAVIRPQYRHYVEGKTKASTLEVFLRNIPTPQPAGQFRLYAGRVENVVNVGTQGWIQYHSFAQVPSDGASFAQQAVTCKGSNYPSSMEAIEIGIQVNPLLYGDWNLHWFSYFRTAGEASGNYVGGYNQDVLGFVPYPGAFPPGATVPAPGAGGGERRFRVTLYNGAWWLQDHNGAATTWVGYYPVGTGTSQIPFDIITYAACEVHWYGEAYDPAPTSWANTDLGNGVFGTSAGSSYMREMWVENGGAGAWFSAGATGALSEGPIDTACYTVTGVGTSSTNGWQTFLNWGGPGGDAAGCD
jgi:hypothetical protein